MTNQNSKLEEKKLATEDEKAKIRRRWKKWLGEIKTDVSDLLLSRYMFQEIGAIVKSNTKIQSPHKLHRWIIQNYAARMSIGVRRLIDKDKSRRKDRQAVSLYKLIEDIKNNCTVIDRKYFIGRYSKKDIDMACFDFERFANKGKQLINTQKLDKDLKMLETKGERIQRFVDKWIAHNEINKRSKLRKIPTFDDLNKFLDVLDKMVCKYYLLVDGGGMTTTLPVIQCDWKKPLRYPWIPNKTLVGVEDR